MMSAWRANINVGSGIYIGLIYDTVCSNGYPETCFREGMYKSSVGDGEDLRDKHAGAYLIAPAAVLGPNH